MEQDALFKLIVGVVLSGLSWFGKQLWDALADLRKDIRDLEVEIAKHYVQKGEFSEAMREIREGLNKIYDKLDGKADK